VSERTPDGSRTSDYDYELPEGRIARHPAARRDGSRLLVVDRGTDRIEDRRFPHLIEWFEPGDLLVVNESRVLPARLRARRATGGRVEILLLSPDEAGSATGAEGEADATGAMWTALIRPGRKLKAGEVVEVDPPGVAPESGRPVAPGPLRVTIVDDPHDEGVRRVRFEPGVDVVAALATFGEIPLPPYLERDAEAEDAERYQTVYARVPGSVAAPTAGLHFTEEVLDALARKGVERAEVTLHVGVGTFRPVEVDDPTAHTMHSEFYEVPERTADAIARCRSRGGRVWAVGTTVVRTLESVALDGGRVAAGSGETRLFLHPPMRLEVVDGLITNFHLPRSTLMMLVAVVAGYERTMRAYRRAVEAGFRFYSYGDAMLIPPVRSTT
jgi:S-adenosylmethionine:tRNA ribosyltransferase-isomerase